MNYCRPDQQVLVEALLLVEPEVHPAFYPAWLQ
jgi:hypothetical protein